MSFIYKLKQTITFRHILYFIALNVMWPSVFSFIGWLPEFRTGSFMLATICVVYLATKGSGRLPSAIRNIIIVQAVTFLFYFLIHSDSSYLTRCFYLVVTTMLLMVQARRKEMEFVDTYLGWLTVQAVMGAVGFVLVYAGVLHAFSTFREFDGHIGQFYGLFTTTVDDASSGFLRVAGFFDEPGAFANWGVMALLFNKLFINNNKVEKLLIVGLISTLSMAFFIQLIMYVFFFYRNKLSKTFTYVVVFIGILTIIASVSPELDHAIFGRFEVNEETGTLNGDNRTEHSIVCKKIWKTSPIVGVGGNNLINVGQQMGEFVGANPYVFLASDGMLGQLVLWLPIFYMFTLRRQNKKFMYAAIIIFVGFLQRPYDPTQLMYPLVLLMMCMEGYRTRFCEHGIKRSTLTPYDDE